MTWKRNTPVLPLRVRKRESVIAVVTCISWRARTAPAAVDRLLEHFQLYVVTSVYWPHVRAWRITYAPSDAVSIHRRPSSLCISMVSIRSIGWKKPSPSIYRWPIYICMLLVVVFVVAAAAASSLVAFATAVTAANKMDFDKHAAAIAVNNKTRLLWPHIPHAIHYVVIICRFATRAVIVGEQRPLRLIFSFFCVPYVNNFLFLFSFFRTSIFLPSHHRYILRCLVFRTRLSNSLNHRGLL